MIVANWKTAFDREESHLGILKLGGDWRLEFPILHSFDEIDPRTRLIWGITDDLRRCTALTLPFGPPGSTSRIFPGNPPDIGERVYKAVGRVTHLLVGATYVADPAINFIRELSFVPKPNRPLHMERRFRFIQPREDIAEIRFTESCEREKREIASAILAYFEPERGTLFEAVIASLGLTLTGYLTTGRTPNSEAQDGEIAFSLRFDDLRSLHSAIEEAYVVCVLMSFISHQHVDPAGLRVLVDGSDQTHELRFRAATRGARNPEAWVGHTLVVPDKDSAEFGKFLQSWYSTNQECLRSRYLYRYSLRQPYSFSNERFLAIFQCLEGLLRMPSHKLLTEQELKSAEKALRNALPSGDASSSDRVELLLRKLRSSNVKSPSSILKSELPIIFAKAGLRATFDVNKFVDNIYLRRNRASHGGSKLHTDSFDDLINETVLITGVCLIVEAQQLGLDARAGLRKFQGVLRIALPFANT